MKKIKAYIAFSTDNVFGDLACSMVFENGASMFSHICSNRSFVYGDLWGNRRERQTLLEMMGYNVEVIERMDGKLPKEVLERNKNPENYQAFVDEYNQFEKELKKDKE